MQISDISSFTRNTKSVSLHFLSVNDNKSLEKTMYGSTVVFWLMEVVVEVCIKSPTIH